MGCASSKLDDLPAVALCRERCAFLDEAIHQRYALAEAHFAYVHSLRAVGASLLRFFDQDPTYSAAGPPSPVLNLPAKRKGDPEPSGPPPAAAAVARHPRSNSNSGSHLQFNSDSEDDDDHSASDSLHHLHHSNDASPSHQYGDYGHVNFTDQEALGSYPQYSQYPDTGGGFMQMNYMQSKATPSVVYQQRPMSPETVHTIESSHYPYQYANENPGSYASYNNYSSYSGFFGSSPPAYGRTSPPPPQMAGSSGASSSKPPPPPPEPPSGSGWDFLNPFENFEKFYPSYTPSRDSKEVREEEGIPDLEDEDYQQEVVKEVYGHQKFVDTGGAGNYSSKAVAKDEETGKADSADSLYRSRQSASSEDDAVEYEVHMVDKKVVDNKERSGDAGNAPAFHARSGFRDDCEVVKEIQVQFERASDSGSELAKILEVGKQPHNRKHAAYQASSKMLNVITPSVSVVASQPSSSKSAESSSMEKIDDANLNNDEDEGTRSGKLSSTLHKLYLWEKKLYEEVKVEEKMRVLHEKKSRKLKRLDERGAEAHKVDTTRILVRSLSTKIRIAIQVVDKISVKINNLRDEELWPQLNEFIQGLSRMWKSMLECHHGQCQAIKEARQLDVIASHKHSSDARLEVTLELEHELLNWTLRFSCWVGAQKGYVRALNNWLLKCLLYVPEETADGIVPFSPGRIGAPPVFVICNQWSQAMERISEKEVVDSMRDLATRVLHLWERDKLEMRNRMMANKDMERKVKTLDKEDQKIQKEIQALDKRMVMVSEDGNNLSLTGQAVYQSDTRKSGSLQVSLQRIFEAMERFTASSLKAYEEVLQRIEEELEREHDKVS
ncbi:hypothetical protein RJ639_005326 [Escallonia herrerae]|uniref:Uncharacterized protein n=1 Tax=Escallonia herrerae TaxID=1293975 RepID=A0AA89AU09_9ASTE|nr:hypothetical protein RJ639_005326 [Escallonia herrerae]